MLRAVINGQPEGDLSNDKMCYNNNLQLCLLSSVSFHSETMYLYYQESLCIGKVIFDTLSLVVTLLQIKHVYVASITQVYSFLVIRNSSDRLVIRDSSLP